jgi:hypothetical protein
VAVWCVAGGWVLAAAWIALVVRHALRPALEPAHEGAATLDFLLACVAGGTAAVVAGCVLTVARPGRLRGAPPWLPGALLVGLTLAEAAVVNGGMAATRPRAEFAAPSALARWLPPPDPARHRLHALRNPQDPAGWRLAHADVAGWHRRQRQHGTYYGPVLDGWATLAAYETSFTLGYARLVRGTNSVGWLAALGVRHLLSEQPLAADGLALEGAEDGVWRYRIDAALPRARLVGAAETVGSVAEARARVTAPAFPHAARVVLAAEDLARAGLTPASVAAAAEGSATLVADVGGTVVVATAAEAPTLCVLADVAYPGWVAEVDGAPAPLLVANGAFRAVPVAAGAHTVTFRYEPWTVTLGLWLTVLGAAAAAAAVAWDLRGHRE